MLEPTTSTTVADNLGSLRTGRLPDLRFIKASIPIADVAVELGLLVIGNMVRCWRPQNHQHGDRTPSVGIDRKRNRIRCFVCDVRAHSSIDLVQMLLGLDTRAAVAWIAARFAVPTIPKGRHLTKLDPFRSVSRVGLGGSLEDVIRSGLWSHLTRSEKAVLPVLCALTDPSANGLQLSYRGIRRFAGIRSDTTVGRVLMRFEAMNVLKVHRGTSEGGLRTCNSYELMLDNPRFLQLMTDIYEWERREIEAERDSRQDERNARRRELIAKKSVAANAQQGVPESHQLPTPT